jgi:hypothetical protein
MTATDLDDFVRGAEMVYETRLQAILEPEHVGEFVAIEPQSGNYFLGQTLSEAMGAAHRLYPDRLAHAMRVGFPAVLHFGMHIR